jgi:hypothetical protein
MFVEIPPHIAVSDFVRRVKGRSSHRVQMEFPELRKRYWGRHFWARGYFCTTSGNITDDVIGGSSGVAFLRKVVDLAFFPELLDVRTEIGPER